MFGVSALEGTLNQDMDLPFERMQTFRRPFVGVSVSFRM